MGSTRLGVLVCATILSFEARVNAADQVEGTRFDAVERAHTVDLTLDRGHATLVVTRTVENPGPTSDQALFHIMLPPGAVATGLRTSGVDTNGRTVWFEGELLEAEAAAKRYQELTGIGGYYPKDPALLSWRAQNHLALQVFPVPAKSSKVVQYTLRIPVPYKDGAYVLSLPSLGTEELPAKLRIVAEHPTDRVTINGVVAAPGASAVASRELVIEMRPEPHGPVDGALASFRFAEGKHLVHAHIDVPARLSRKPEAASVVVLVDVSHSMGHQLSGALSAARAYIASFPGANVEVLTFARTVKSPFGGPLPAKDALARLFAFHPAEENGSQLDDAVAQADAKLAAAPAGRPRRLLVLTDLAVRTALAPETFGRQAITSGALVHVATAETGAASLVRDDDAPWAALPRRTGGLFWHANANEKLGASERLLFEEWVRPTRIDKVRVTGLPEDAIAEASLPEGAGFEFLGVAPRASSNVALEGELWSSSVRWSTAASARDTQRWAGLVFGSPLLPLLDESEMMSLAMYGRAVSPVTSYLAIEPGVRPSTEGLDWSSGEGGGGSGEGIGLGCIGTIGHGYGGASPDRQPFLNQALANAMTACGAAPGSIGTAAVESTLAEIVDLREVTLMPGRDPKKEECVRERLWTETLPASFVESRAQWVAKAAL